MARLRKMRTEVCGRAWHAWASTGHEAGTCPVVLVHGFGISSSYFMPAAERLASEFEVFAPDLPGHGRSDAPARALDIGGHAEALRAWLRKLGIAGACLVGHSMGCQVVTELAARHPDVADRLVLIGPTMDPRATSTLRAAARLIAGGAEERPSMIGLIVRDYVRMAPRLLKEFRAMREHRIEDALMRVAAPVLLVTGQKDRVAPTDWIEGLARLAADARTAVVPDAGHAVHYSDVERLLPLIAPFLRERSTRERRAVHSAAPRALP